LASGRHDARRTGMTRNRTSLRNHPFPLALGEGSCAVPPRPLQEPLDELLFRDSSMYRNNLPRLTFGQSPQRDEWATESMPLRGGASSLGCTPSESATIFTSPPCGAPESYGVACDAWDSGHSERRRHGPAARCVRGGCGQMSFERDFEELGLHFHGGVPGPGVEGLSTPLRHARADRNPQSNMPTSTQWKSEHLRGQRRALAGTLRLTRAARALGYRLGNLECRNDGLRTVRPSGYTHDGGSRRAWTDTCDLSRSSSDALHGFRGAGL
jgi:hypothetical protein